MELSEIIKQIHSQWLIAKEQRRQRCLASNLPVVAQRLADCTMFKGDEDIAKLALLFTSPQGMEFCLAANFPTLSTFRLFKSFNTQQYGIYIDAGNITLKNPSMAVLIGKTIATIECDSCAMHKVITLHGASATVLASGWAVVRTESGVSSNIVRRSSDNSIIL